MEVIIKSKGHEEISIHKLKPFQGNLKDLDKNNFELLRKSILTMGFTSPINVWVDGENHFVIDGHQRLRVLIELHNQGVKVPNVPINIVEADTFEDAKKNVLYHASQFGKINSDGLYQYTIENKFDVDDLIQSYSLPEIKFHKFKEEYFSFEEPEEYEQKLSEPKKTFCPSCQSDLSEFVKNLKDG